MAGTIEEIARLQMPPYAIEPDKQVSCNTKVICIVGPSSVCGACVEMNDV